MKPTRRSMLLSTLGATAAFGGVSTLSQFAQAGSTTTADRYYIFCYFSGGWDILLGLDPRDPLEFRDDRKGETLIQPAYDQLDDPPTADVVQTSVTGMQFGPYIGELQDQAERICVVRGMSMETLTHETGRRRFITGKPPSGVIARGSSVGTALAAHLGNGEAIPQLSARVESYNDRFDTSASALRVNDVTDLLRALTPNNSSPSDLERAQLDAMLEYFRTCPTHLQSKLRAESHSFRQSASDLVSQGLGDLFDFGASTPAMGSLREFYGFSPSQLSSIEARAAMAVTAITSGISRVVNVRVTDSLDTHGNEWATDQGPDQMRGFDTIARMAQDLESRPHPTGGTWLDRTVIVGFSEFSRTALINDNGGRDHSLTNACMLLGAGIRGGQVVGASSDHGMFPTPTNLTTGAYDPNGEIIRPEHVLRALLTDAGIPDDVTDLRVDPLTAITSS